MLMLLGGWGGSASTAPNFGKLCPLHPAPGQGESSCSWTLWRQWNFQYMGGWRRIPVISGSWCGRRPHRSGKRDLHHSQSSARGLPTAAGRVRAVRPRFPPAPHAGGIPCGARSRGRARSPSLLEAVRVALPRGPPAASIPEESWAEGGLGSPFSLPPLPGVCPGTRRQRRARLWDGGPGSRAAGAGRCRRRGSAEGPAEPRAPPEPSWRGGRLSAASPRQRPPRSCSCP